MGYSKKKRNRNDSNNNIAYLFIVLVTGFLAIAPFFRGLYFRENFIPSVVYVCCIFLLYMSYKLIMKGSSFAPNYIDMAVLIIPLAYFISFLFSANIKDAFDGFIKYSGYILLYYIVSDLSKDNRCFRYLINGIIASVFMGAAAVVLTASGLWEGSGVIFNNTVYGLYQYTNTTAAVLGTGLFLCLGCLIENESLGKAICYQIAAFSIFSIFILTLSRGAYLVFAILGVVYFITLGFIQKLQLLLHGFISLLASLLFVFAYYKYFSGIKILFYFIIAAVLAALLQWLYFKHIRERLSEIKVINNRYIHIGILIFVAIASFFISYKEPMNIKVNAGSSKYVIVDNLKPSTEYKLRYQVSANGQDIENYGVIISGHNKKYEYTELIKEMGSADGSKGVKELTFKTNEDTQVIYIYFCNTAVNDSEMIYKNAKIDDADGNLAVTIKQFKFIPRRIAERIESFSLKTGYNDARFVYARDGLKIFGDYFLFGAGGGGWKNLYRSYQSYPYNSAEAHNFYVQYAVEVGILGLIGLISVLILVIRSFIIHIRKKDYFGISVYMGLFMSLLHALLDFNLSLAAPAYLTWALIGCISTDNTEVKVKPQHEKYFAGGAIIIAVLLLFNCASAYIGMLYGNKAAEAIAIYQGSDNPQELERAIGLYEKAMKLDRYNGAYRMDYAQLLYSRARDSEDVSPWAKIERNLSEVRKLEPNNDTYFGVMINLMLQNGKLREGTDFINEAVTSQPLNMSLYQTKIDVNYQIADFLIKNKEKKEAIYYLDNMIEVEEELEAAEKRSTKKIEIPEKIPPMIGLARNWKLNAEKSLKASGGN